MSFGPMEGALMIPKEILDLKCIEGFQGALAKQASLEADDALVWCVVEGSKPNFTTAESKMFHGHTYYWPGKQSGKKSQ